VKKPRMPSADINTSYKEIHSFGMCRVDYGVSPKTEAPAIRTRSADMVKAEHSEHAITSYKEIHSFGMCRVDYGVSTKTLPVQHDDGVSTKTLPVQHDEHLTSASAIRPDSRHRLRELINARHVVRQPTLPFKKVRPIDELVSCSARKEVGEREGRPADVEQALRQELTVFLAQFKTTSSFAGDSTETLAKCKPDNSAGDITDSTKTLHPDDDMSAARVIRPPRLSDLNIRHAPDICA